MLEKNVASLDISAIVHDYQNNHPRKAIAEKYGVTDAQIVEILLSHNIRIRRNSTLLETLSLEELKMVMERSQTIAEFITILANECNIYLSIGTIKNFLRKFNIRKRNNHNKKRLTLKDMSEISKMKKNGFSLQQISQQLKLSPKLVHEYLTSKYQKVKNQEKSLPIKKILSWLNAEKLTLNQVRKRLRSQGITISDSALRERLKKIGYQIKPKIRLYDFLIEAKLANEISITYQEIAQAFKVKVSTIENRAMVLKRRKDTANPELIEFKSLILLEHNEEVILTAEQEYKLQFFKKKYGVK